MDSASKMLVLVFSALARSSGFSFSEAYNLRANGREVAARNRCVLSLFHNLGGIFQIQLRSVTYRCTSLSSAFTEIFVWYVKVIQTFDPPWEAVNISVFVVAELRLLLARQPKHRAVPLPWV